jgi:hypothetical protein
MQTVEVIWHPVEDAKPEQIGNVLLTTEGRFGKEVLVGIWLQGHKKFRHGSVGKVIAWAQLPVAYKSQTLLSDTSVPVAA